MSQVNITLNTNTVDINTTNNQIVVTDPTNPTTVNITQPVTTVVEVITAGPQGPMGPPGTGSIANTGSFVTTSSFNAYTGSNTSQFAGTASFAATASFALNAGGTIINTGSFVTTSSFNSFTSSYNTGSFTGSFIGSLVGTASFAISASWAPSTIQTLQEVTNDGNNETTNTIIVKDSENKTNLQYNSIVYQDLDDGGSTVLRFEQTPTPDQEVLIRGLGGTMALTSDIPDTGSLVTTSSFNNFTSSYNTGSFTGSFSGLITGSLFGTASFASTSSFATTSSFAVSASWAPMRPGGSDTQIQFNSGSTLTGRSSFTFNYQSQSLQQGEFTTASGSYSHAQGYSTIASGSYSHAEGNTSIAIGPYSHAEGGSTQAIGTSSHAEGAGTIALGDFQHVQGRFNITSSANSAFIIGNGINLNNRSNLVFASGSTFQVTGSVISTQGFTGSLLGTSSFAQTASFAPAYLPLTGGTINGNVTVNGTASIAFLNVTIESASVIYSSGSNQLGDATNDTQTLIGTVIVSGSQQITGSLNVSQGITGSLFGTSSYAINAATASNILGGSINHIPYFKTADTLATSSLYQSGSSTIIINQDNATTANPEALYVWQPHPTSFNVISGKGNINNYLQLNIQNTNQGNNASSDVVATADNGNESTNYIDMGINSENYNVNFIGGANDAYLYSTGRHLHIGNASNFPVQIFAGGSDVDIHNKLELNPNNQHSMSGSLDVSGSIKAFSFTGSLFGTASYASNGGVTQLLAGPNITLSPSTGVGQVTISSTGGGGGFNTATGSYGSFYDTTTQTNPVANVPRSMSLNTTDISNGVSVSGSTNPFNTYIKTQNAGVYNIQFSAQLDKTDSGADEIVIWLRKNGINLTDTATTITLVGNNGKQVAAWNWFVNSAANDYYQIIWQSADTNVRLLAEPTDGHPGIPSVIVTANRVDQFLSNTGSFSGTFTGDLIGTSSFATTSSYTQNAQSASYALTASYALNGSGGGSGNGFPFSGSAVITGSLLVTSTIQIDGSLIDFSKVNSSVVGTNDLYQIATGSYTAAFTKYVVSNGANARAGEFVTVWNGTNVVSYDNSTTDIGNTSDVTFASSIVTSQIKIDAVTATSAWLIKSTTTFI